MAGVPAVMRRSLRHGLRVLGALLLVLVLGLLALRLLLPEWEGLATQVERRVGVLIDREVEIGSLRLGWSGWTPELVAREVSIHVPDGPPLVSRELGVSLAPLRSLRTRSPVLRKARLSGVVLHVARDGDGTWDVHGWRFGGRGSVAMDWARHFAGMERLEIVDASLHWEDARTRVQTGLFIDTLGVHADASGLRLVGRGSFFPEAGGPVYVGVEVPPAGPDRIELFLGAQDLQIPYWSGLGSWVRSGPQGTSSVRIWATLEEGRVRHLQGEHQSALLLTDRDHPEWLAIGHRFQWQRQAARSVSHWAATTPGAGNIRLEYRVSDAERGVDQLTVAAADVDLRTFARPVARLHLDGVPDLGRLADLDPSGRLERLFLRLERGTEGWRVDVAEAEARSLAIAAVDGRPGFSGIDAGLDWTGSRGRVSLSSSGLELVMPELFAEALWADRLEALVTVDHGAHGPDIAIRDFELENAHAGLEGGGHIALGPAGPHLDVALHIRHADGSQVERYLPVHRLPSKTYRWLVSSIRAGTVTGGGMVFRGRPSEFPFREDQGLFHLWANVEDGLLDYRPGWPQARSLTGTLVFRNAGFRAERVSGEILDSSVSDAEVVISDMLVKPELEIRGMVQGPVADLPGYLQQAGIAGRFGPHLEAVETVGSSELNLGLAIPLHGAGPRAAKASGLLRLDRAALALQEPRVRLTGIRGEVRFDPESGIRGQDIIAQVNGERVELDLRRDASGARTRILARGRQPFAPWLGDDPGLLRRVQGAALWSAEILLDAQGDSSLELYSDLEGVQIDWPAPLAKTTGTRRPLHISWPLLQASERQGRVDFDGVLSAEVRIAPGSAQQPRSLRAVALALGRPQPELPPVPERGIRLHARLESPDVEAWTRVLETLGPDAAIVRAAEGLPLQDADIEAVGGLRWGSRSFPAIRIRLQSTRDGRRLAIDSDWVQGQAWSLPVDAPADSPGDRWHVHLSRLHLENWGGPAGTAGVGAEAALADPRNWPAVDLRIADLRVDHLRLAGLEVELAATTAGLELRRLHARSPEDGLFLDGRGHWVVRPEGGTESQVVAEVEGSDWGRGLDSMGVSAAMEQGTGTARLRLSWPAPLYAPHLASLDGTVAIEIADGRLREVEPGAGRLLGLVSLDLVPRRLRLDFRDVYTQGLSFDQMAGEAVLSGGELLLPELKIRGPAALVRVSGRTGLVTRDFDQSIVVVPRLRSTLPIVGALLGGPVTGAVVLLVERALGIGDQVEEAARVEYFVTGPWSDPVVKARVRTEEGASD